MTDTPYSPDTACALAIGATSAGWIEQNGVTWDGDLATYNLRATEQRNAVFFADLRDNLAALRATLTPPTTTVRIMAVGDSITVGTGSTGPGGQLDPWGNGNGPGWKAWLVDLLARRRIATQLTVVAQGGQTLRTMTPPTLAALPTARPDIVLIHLGTNDIGTDTGDWQTRYGQLIDQILASSPTVRVACGHIAHYRRPNLDAGVDTINGWIDAAVQARQSTGRVITADTGVITQHWTADGTHPLDAAHLTMAQQWHTAIGPWLPQ